MNFEKLHYPSSAGNKEADYVMCEGKKYEVIRRNDGIISENLIDENTFYARSKENFFSLDLGNTFYNTEHKIKIIQEFIDEEISFIENSIGENLSIFRKELPLELFNKSFKVKISAKNTKFIIDSIISREPSVWTDLTISTKKTEGHGKMNRIGNDVFYENDGKLSMFYTKENVWSEILSNTPFTFTNQAGRESLEDKVYFFSNASSGKGTHCFDITANTWTLKKTMPTSRSHTTCKTIKDNIHVMLGYSSSSYNLNQVYNTSTDTWTSKSNFPYSSYGEYAALIEDKIYLKSAKRFSHYNTITDTHTLENQPLKARNGATAESNGNLYFIAGQFVDETNTPITRNNEMYDIATRTWTSKEAVSFETTKDLCGIISINDEIFIGFYKYNNPLFFYKFE